MYRIYNIYWLAAFGTLGGALFGFDISSMSAWIGVDSYMDYFHSPNSTLQGGITSSMSAGSLAGALFAGWLSDRVGRKKALQLASLVWIVGSVLSLSAQNVAHLIVGRVVNGLCVGITSSQVPVYLAELSPKNIRGRVVGLQQWSIEWGILIMYFISYGCSFMNGGKGPAGFRTAWGIQAVPALILFGAVFFFPESPRWLASQDRWEEALDVLAHLHAGGDAHHALVQAEYEEVKEAQRTANEARNLSWAGLFTRTMWRRTAAGVFVQVWQQLLGGNIMMYYVVYVFKMAGLTGNVNLVSSSIQYVIFLLTTVVTLVFIDRLGRRPLLIGGGLLCMLMHFAVAGTMAVHGHPVDSVDGDETIKWEVHGPPSKAIIALTYLFVAVYGLTWAPVAWIYISEVFPNTYRAKGTGLAAAGNWAFNFALAFFVPPAFHNIQWKTYIIFGIFCLVGVIHVFFMFPETCNKTLEEIDEMFNLNLPAWRTAKFESHLDTRVRELEAKGGDNQPTDEKRENVTVKHMA